MTENCPRCGDTPGWRSVIVDGVMRLERCECRSQSKSRRVEESKGEQSRSQKVEGQKESKVEESKSRRAEGLLTFNFQLSTFDFLSQDDKRVAELIQKCRGAAQAITSAEIAGALWPGTSMDPRARERLRRLVTASVERLCDLARVPIAATKAPPYGYFIPQTAEELKDMHDRLWREGIKRLVRSQLYGKDADLVRELEGQLQLGPSVVSGPLSVEEKVEAASGR